MANNSTREKSIINQSDACIVLTESKISLSDEKLKGMLLRTYERAEKDTLRPSITKHYGVFLSASGTLILSLLTSSFGDIGMIEAIIVTRIMWVIAVILGLMGMILLFVYSNKKANNSRDSRDKAIDEILKEYFKAKVSSDTNSTSNDLQN